MNKPIPGERWERKRDKQIVKVDYLTHYRTGAVVTFTEHPMLIEHERMLDVFLRVYRKVS